MKSWAYLSDDDETITIVVRMKRREFRRFIHDDPDEAPFEVERLRDQLWKIISHNFTAWRNRTLKSDRGEYLENSKQPSYIKVNEIDKLLEDIWGYRLRRYKESGRSVFSEEDRRSWRDEGNFLND